MPNWTTMTLAGLRAASRANIITAVGTYFNALTKRQIIELLMDATEFTDPPTVTQGEHGILTSTHAVRDALGGVLRVESMEWAYYPTGEVDEITRVVKNAAGDEIDDSVIKHHIGPQPSGHFVLTVVLAPQDVSSITKPISANYWKLIDIGNQATLGAVDAPASALLDLHEELWAMSPAGTFGVLAVASARGNWFLPKAVRHHTGVSTREALARRNRIAGYLDSLGKDTTLLRAARDEHEQMGGVMAALGYVMNQLWAAMGR